MISAPAGAGKTIGVASWARNLDPSVNVIWLNLRDGSPTACPLIRSLLTRPPEPGGPSYVTIFPQNRQPRSYKILRFFSVGKIAG